MDFISTAFEFITQQGPAIIGGLLSIVGGASVIAALTPTPKDDAFLAKVRAALDVLAANVGNAKPKK